WEDVDVRTWEGVDVRTFIPPHIQTSTRRSLCVGERFEVVERRHAVEAADLHEGGFALLSDAVEHADGLVHRADCLPLDPGDDGARGEAVGGGGAALPDERDEGARVELEVAALLVAEVAEGEAPGLQLVEVDAVRERRRRARLGVGRRGLVASADLGGPLPEGSVVPADEAGVEVAPLAAAPDGDADGVVRAAERDGDLELVRRVDLAPVDGEEDVAGAEAGALGGALVGDARDEDARDAVEVEAGGVGGGDGAEFDAGGAALEGAGGGEVRGEARGEAGRG